MTIYAGRDVLVKIGDGGAPPAFASLGVARATGFDIVIAVADVTAVGSGVAARYSGSAGRQDARITLQGIFKDSAAEGQLRMAALGADVRRYQMIFANGEIYEADFIVESYKREGTFDGLEAFAAVLLRSGEGTWTDA